MPSCALPCSDQNGARNILKVFWALAYGEARPEYLARPKKGSKATPSSALPPAPPTQVRRVPLVSSAASGSPQVPKSVAWPACWCVCVFDCVCLIVGLIVCV